MERNFGSGVRRKGFEVLFAWNCDDDFASFDCNHCGAGAEDGGNGRFDGRGFCAGRSASREGCRAGEDDGRRRGGVCPGVSLDWELYEYILRSEEASWQVSFSLPGKRRFPWK